MELLFLLLLIILSSIILYLIKERKDEQKRMLNYIDPGENLRHNSVAPAKPEDKRRMDDSGLVTSMTKYQIDEYLSKKDTEKLSRIATIDPEDVIYINENSWFYPKSCDVFPSRTLIGDELYHTTKGSWIKKTGKSQTNKNTEDQYQIISRTEAYIFLEENGYTEMAALYAPADPRNEV